MIIKKAALSVPATGKHPAVISGTAERVGLPVNLPTKTVALKQREHESPA
jgi:hypothetical protein